MLFILDSYSQVVAIVTSVLVNNLLLFEIFDLSAAAIVMITLIAPSQLDCIKDPVFLIVL